MVRRALQRRRPRRLTGTVSHRAPRRRVPARGRGVGVLGVLLALTLGGCTTGAVDPGSTSSPGISSPGTSTTATPRGTGGTPAPPAPAEARTDPDARRAAVAELLDARAAAFVTGDLAGARATQVPGAVVPATARIVRLPLAGWSYAVTASTERSGLLDVRATVTWQLEGESSGSVLHERIALRWSTDRWLLASERSTSDAPPPWELGGLTVVRGTSSIVVAVGDGQRARTAARLVDEAVAGVSAVYGEDWRRRAVLVLTSTDEQMARGLGWTVERVRAVGAVTTSVGSLESVTAPADRVWTRASVWDRLPDRFRLVLLRHELTHVATRATFNATVPLWLEEGYADHVGYAGSDIPLRQAVVELLDEVRSSGVPTTLPADSEFRGDRAGAAYAAGHLACAILAERWGEDGLRRVYRLTATGDAEPARNLERALREVTGAGLAGLTATWRSRAAELAR